ncbi:hypothetical protein ACWOFR_10335 [Carnobacterium gallinarum]|uniref:hypothetical protein n=1 Tax=Carnobacterium gallinarum TaxID=2749 RepID=UPI0005525625|nr:hypothetical protein [Carnobacterium gallinarum]
MDFEYELRKIQRDIAKLDKETSLAVRVGLEEVLNWAKKGYQKQALREQIKQELARRVQLKKELVTAQWYQESNASIYQAKDQLNDSFTSRSGENLQQTLVNIMNQLSDTTEQIRYFKQSIKGSDWQI